MDDFLGTHTFGPRYERRQPIVVTKAGPSRPLRPISEADGRDPGEEEIDLAWTTWQARLVYSAELVTCLARNG